MTYQTTPAGIAAALRRAADDIEAMGDVELSPVLVTVDLQAVRHKGTESERIATVDALSIALVGVPSDRKDGKANHSTPLDAREARDGVHVSVYTAPGEYTRGVR